VSTGPGGPEPGRHDRAPGWRDVLLVAGVVLGAVFAIELASIAVPPIRDAFAGFPVTAAVLVVGTVTILGLALLRRPRG